jgi:hypothetical protein
VLGCLWRQYSHNYVIRRHYYSVFLDSFSLLRRISAECIYCYTKLTTVWEYKKKLADTLNRQRKVERRTNIYRKESILRIVVRRKSPWCQWRWACCIVNQSKWVLIVQNVFNWEPISPTHALGQYKPEGRGFDFRLTH